MAQLMSTIYTPVGDTITIIVQLVIQGQPSNLSCIAAESDLVAIATKHNRTDWNTNDCCEFASLQMGLTVTL